MRLCLSIGFVYSSLMNLPRLAHCAPWFDLISWLFVLHLIFCICACPLVGCHHKFHNRTGDCVCNQGKDREDVPRVMALLCWTQFWEFCDARGFQIHLLLHWTDGYMPFRHSIEPLIYSLFLQTLYEWNVCRCIVYYLRHRAFSVFQCTIKNFLSPPRLRANVL